MISELIHTLIYRPGTGSPGRVKKITDALSHDNPLPDEIAEAMKTNREVFNLYMDEQRNLIRLHNAAVKKAVQAPPRGAGEGRFRRRHRGKEPLELWAGGPGPGPVAGLGWG